jgi:hypothetical protein
MAMEQSIGSILAVDCGTVTTKAILLDRVGGSYRFVARGETPTTIERPWEDVAVGVLHAIEQIEEVTGRTLLDQGGGLITPEDGSVGVDAFVALVSAAKPLEIILAGLVRDLSLASAERAAAGTYTITQGIISRDRETGMMTEEEQIQQIVDLRPEVVCIVGGTDGGAVIPVLRLVEATALGCSMIEEDQRPQVLFAGNKVLRQRVAGLIGEQTDVRPTDNVRPIAGVENLWGLRSELESIYGQQKLKQMPGGRLLENWSATPVTPSAKAFSQLIQYIWHLDESPKGTLGIDIGAAHTTAAAAFDGSLHLNTHSDLGATFGSPQLMVEEPQAVLRWMPSPMEIEQAVAICINQTAQPWTIPQEADELWLQQAVLREVIRRTLRAARLGWTPGEALSHPNLMPIFDPILLSGGALAGAPRPGQVALIALDAIQPIGISTLLLDRYGLAPVLGGVASLKPLATVETLDNGGIVNLATVVAPVGTARQGDMILKVRIEYEEGGALDVEVPFGSLEVLPLPPGQEAVLKLSPTRRHRFDVGLGGPGKGGRRRVRGGLVGLIIDARGRPLRLPRDPEERQSQVQQWLWDVGG